MGLQHLLGRVGLGLLCAATTFAIGCHTTKKISTQISDGYYDSVSAPASSVGCMWKKQLEHLNDPTREGVKAPGMVGRLSLFAADGLPTRANGDLQIMAHDETPRKAGEVAGMAEMWHFDPATLKRLRTKDENQLDSYLIFLPWPKEWKDVTKVRLQVKYEPKGGTAITTADQVVSFEVAPLVGVGGGIGSQTHAKAAPSEIRGIPSLKTVMKQATGDPTKEPVVTAKATNLPLKPVTLQSNAPVIVQAGVVTPVPAVTPVVPSSALVLPANAPMVVAPETTPMPMPTPPPPPSMPKIVEVTPAPPAAPQPVASTVSVTVGEELPAMIIPAAK